MARVKKAQITLDSLMFSSAEQKVLRLLLSEPTTTFTSRVISSRLKGVRGLGGVEGIAKVLDDLMSLGMIDYVDNKRAVRLQDDNTIVQVLKTFSAICDLETLKGLLIPVSSKGVLFGSRANGRARSDSDYNLYIVSETPEEVRKVGARYPLSRSLALKVVTPEEHNEVARQDVALAEKIGRGIVLWGSSW